MLPKTAPKSPMVPAKTPQMQQPKQQQTPQQKMVVKQVQQQQKVSMTPKQVQQQKMAAVKKPQPSPQIQKAAHQKQLQQQQKVVPNQVQQQPKLTPKQVQMAPNQQVQQQKLAHQKQMQQQGMVGKQPALQVQKNAAKQPQQQQLKMVMKKPQQQLKNTAPKRVHFQQVQKQQAPKKKNKPATMAAIAARMSGVTIVLGSRLNQSFQQHKRIRKLHREARYLHIKSKVNTMELHKQCKERYKLEKHIPNYKKMVDKAVEDVEELAKAKAEYDALLAEGGFEDA